MKSILILASLYCTQAALAEEALQSQLIFFTTKRAAMNYDIKKISEKPESYTLTYAEAKLPSVTRNIPANDAKLILSEMTTMAWDFQYKLKPGKPGCEPFATLRVKESATTVCREEKAKSAKLLGLMSRLNFLLKRN